MDTSGDLIAGATRGGKMDQESTEWLIALKATGPERDAALDRLHEQLLRVALQEVRRRSDRTPIAGPELDDIAHQAGADAMLAILAKLDTFRGESRFTTWIYKFVILEVASKIGRHYWRNPPVSLQDEDWDRLPDRFGLDPGLQVEMTELVGAVRHAVTETLTDYQRRLFVAVVVNGVPLDALVAQLGVNRNAIYKALFDTRRKIRAFLAANGYLPNDTTAGKS